MSHETVAKKDLTLKDGRVIRQGTPLRLHWDRDKPWLTEVVSLSDGKAIPGTSFFCKTTQLKIVTNDCYPITMAEIEESVCDSVCKSVLGEDIEPDGFDEKGSPSWLLVLGLI